ncbi:glycine--tRNA ligase [Thalassoroseus pseudoceratinae]|uniref:glycine--tRNA ligase n=1 Tax=Thalassoroseus pseudoceratinae TaxID=2713176 RepID=UPI0019811B3B|nr:glycine--tRNA ligase [Thalassoroseus pseudoceratinae]
MAKSMDEIVALCKRRGFVFQSSDIYGGLQGFWDYGPLGTELKRNVREAWYRDMITNHNELATPEGAPSPFQMNAVECSQIMHPHVWKVSGHYDLFVDKMVDCRESKKRYRFDHLQGRWASYQGKRVFVSTSLSSDEGLAQVTRNALKFFGLRTKDVERIEFGTGEHGGLAESISAGTSLATTPSTPYPELRPIWDADSLANILAPDATKVGTLTEPRDFKLMFETTIGALGGDEDKAYLRPETAQGMFVNFKNVMDTTRVKVPFGIAQIGKSFRNEITPRNFTFRSREFEQMEMEFFCRPDESRKWYEYWRDRRYQWYVDLGLSKENLILRDHTEEELAHYSVGTADVEYAFPFLSPGEYGELEGIAHRGDFDLRSHMEGKLVKNEAGELVVEKNEHGQPKYRGSGKDMQYFDDQSRERFIPHVIEPAAGADRATLAFICEAYREDEQPNDKGKMEKRTVMQFHPHLAPIKAAVFPLIKKNGMPEKAAEVYHELKKAGIVCQYDQQGAIGRRYRRQDEIGTPYCITIDGDTLDDGTVTIRDRDSLEQERIPADRVVEEITGRMKSV